MSIPAIKVTGQKEKKNGTTLKKNSSSRTTRTAFKMVTNKSSTPGTKPF